MGLVWLPLGAAAVNDTAPVARAGQGLAELGGDLYVFGGRGLAFDPVFFINYEGARSRSSCSGPLPT